MPSYEIATRYVLAPMLAATGQTQEALPHAQRALELATQTGDQEAANHLRTLITQLTTPADSQPK